jgi:ribosomal protein S8
MNLTILKFLSQLKNASNSRKEFIILNYNKSYTPLLKILYKEGFILNFSKTEEKILIRFRYYFNIKSLQKLKIISTLTKPIFLNYYEICKLYKKDKLLIFSTPKGFLTSSECTKLKTGGIFLFIC